MGGHWSKTGLPIWPVMYIQLTLYWLDFLFLLVFFFFEGRVFLNDFFSLLVFSVLSISTVQKSDPVTYIYTFFFKSGHFSL